MRFLAEDGDGEVQLFEADSWEDAEDHCLCELWNLQGEVIATIEDGVLGDGYDIDLSNVVVTTVDTLQ
jgi:hypothetical protein